MNRSLSIPSLALLLLAAPGLPGTHAADSAFCVPEKAARRSLERFEAILRECGRRPECWDEGRAVLEAALEKHPEDPHLHRAFQDLFKRWEPRGRDITPPDLEPWYQTLLEDDPENPVYLYGYGRWADDPAVALSLFERAVDADPDFPWGHVGMAYVSASRGESGDSERLKKHLGRFIEICPSRSKVALSYADNIDDPQFWHDYLPRLRAALGKEPVAGTYVHFAQVWHLELAYLPADEHVRVRQRIAADLRRIRALELWDNEGWTATLLAGYRLLGDEDEAARIEDRIAKRRSRGP